MARKRTKRYAGIAHPQLPPSAALQALPAPQLADGAAFCKALVIQADLSGQGGADVLFDQVILRNTVLDETRLVDAQCIDVQFDGCAAVNARWEKIHLQRVEWANARLSGIRLNDARIENLVMHGCQLDFALFWAARLEHARFEDCRLVEASFEGAKLDGVIFRNCDLSRADMRGASLAGADLRGSILHGMQIGPKELAGAIVEPEQAIALAALFGIVVKALDDEEPEA
jgi:uncharacterized protein YjbI with pentapeptide repeats